MCGICGVFNIGKDQPVAAAVVDRMNAKLSHRGPDDCGAYVDDFIGLGHRRLSIIDPRNGKQPLCNEDGTVWITYNGEIYNYRELRAILAQRGHRFATNCDTEVVVHAYEEFGTDCVTKFNGMFAFAVWDAKKELLFLARDRMGIKPLYYAVRGSNFIFASEVKAILEHPDVSVEVEAQAIPEYLLCTTLLDSRTMFRNVQSLRPGSTLVVQDGVVSTSQYWSLATNGLGHNGDSFAHCRDQVRDLLDSSVNLMMVSDVPLGTLLSGGLDSSIVSAIAARQIHGRLKTFSMGYHNSRTIRSDDTDPHYAHLVARAYQTDHAVLLFQPTEYSDVMRRVTWHVEKPVDLTSPSLFLLYRGVKPTVTVVMSGEGADELFAGYYFFLDSRQNGQTEFPWAPYLDEVSALLDPTFARETRCVERIRATLADELLSLHTDDRLNKFLFLFLKYYLVDMLERLDKTSMAWGVESRVPFLDHRLVEYVVNMPSSYKASSSSEKILLKSIATDILPADIVKRKKRPVPIPVDPRSVLTQSKRANELVQSSGSRIGNYFNKRQVDDFFKRKGQFKTTDNLAVYRTAHALIALDAWHSTFGVTS